MQLASFSVRNYQFTIILFLLALFLGLNSLVNMPRGEDPPFQAPIFLIVAVFPGTSPLDMEELVANPIEQALYELDDVKKIISDCEDGLLTMRVEFSYGVQVDSKNNDVVREVNRLRSELPEGLALLSVTRATSSDVAILQAGLVSEKAGYAEMNRYAEQLKKNLERIPDLKKVRIEACPEQQVSIALDLERMARMRISANQVMGALQSQNVNIPGGSIDLGARRFNVETNSKFRSVEDLQTAVVHSGTDGRIVLLRDIATVGIEEEEPVYLARYNGKKSVWVIAMLKDLRNIVQNDKRIKAALSSFEKELPPHIRLKVSFDQAVNVKHRLAGLGRDFAIAIFLVLLTLLPLGFRASMVVMISIPLSLAIGLAALDAMGYSLNQLSIVGLVISLGLLVDDSIVVVENIERFLRLGHSRRSAAVLATKQIGIAIIGCTATLILAFLPLAYMPEASGDFIRSLPVAVIATIVASLLVALTIIPFLSSMLLKQHERTEGNLFLRLFKKYLNDPYRKVLEAAIRHPVIALSLTFLIFAGSLMLIPRIGFSLFPLSEKPMFMVDVETPLGTSLATTDAVVREVEEVLQRTPRIVDVSTNVGKGNPRIYYNEFQKKDASHFAQLFVRVEQDMQVPEIMKLTDSLRVQLAGFPGARIQVRRFQQGPPVEAPVEIRIQGENLDTLAAWSFRVEAMMRQIPGLIYVKNPLRTPKTDLEVHIDKRKAGMAAVPISEIARTIRLALAGLEVGKLRAGDGDEFPMVVSVEKSEEDALQLFSRVYVSSLSGALIPLDQVAELRLRPSPPLLRHLNKERFCSVTAFVASGYNTQSLTDGIMARLAKTQVPPGIQFQAGGEAESRAESFGGMEGIVLISVFLLFAILILEFRTFKSTLIVLSVIPLGIIGALVMLYVIGETLSFVATVGMIALVGIEIKNSILLVDYTNQLRQGGMPLDQAVVEGAETRFLPILLTTLTAIGGLIPIAAERSPLISPLAFVLIGGLISSTLLSRIVTPLLYRLLPPEVGEKG